MTLPRYLAVLGPASRRNALLAEMPLTAEWRRLLDTPLLGVLSDDHDALMLPGHRGLILGQLYLRGGSPRATRADKLAALTETLGGEALTARHWGPWVAFLTDAGGNPSAVRAPFSELPCWWREVGGAIVLSSDLDLLERAGPKPRIDWPAIGRMLLFDGVRGPTTCLEGIFELEGGGCLAFADGASVLTALWSPWTVLASARTFSDPSDARDRLRDIVRECVAARARDHGHVLLRLSGGLDSSIVAAALARSGVPFTCLNLVSEDRSGDEREFARAVTGRLRASLTERLRDASAVNLDVSPSAHLPRPSKRSFALESERIAEAVAAETQATSIFDGGGGDNVFCSLQSVAPIVDRLRSSGFGREARATARDVCILAQSKLGTVWKRALIRNWRVGADRRWPADPFLLAPDFVSAQPLLARHPWLRAPAGVLPGQAAHVALLLAAADAVGDQDPDARARCSPLLSQPVIETCLRIPSWMWMAGGLNRIVARRAFADVLPAEVAFRRGKGSPEGFVDLLFAANRRRIFDELLHGQLVANGIADRPGLEALSRTPTARIGNLVPRLMRLHDAEIWARHRAR